MLLPFAERLVEGYIFSWTQIKAAAAAAYLVQVIAVSVTGRIDAEVAKDTVDEQKGSGEAEPSWTNKRGQAKQRLPKRARILPP